MVTKDEIEFLSLPDWKKVHLKISYSKFVNYRLMTEEQEFDRKQKIYTISSHYGKIDLDELQNNPSMTLDNSWPKNLEKFVTPRLLDMFDTQWFCKFGHCYFCNHFNGYNKMHYKFLFAKRSKNRLIPFSGRCKHILNRTKKDNWITGKQHNFVDPKFCCYLWEPMALYFQIIQIEIADRLNKFENPETDYDIEDYAFDLHNVNLWNYFFNKYERYEY